MSLPEGNALCLARCCGSVVIRWCVLVVLRFEEAQIRLSWSGHENEFKLMLYQQLRPEYTGKQSFWNLSELFLVCCYHLNNNVCLCLRHNEKVFVCA